MKMKAVVLVIILAASRATPAIGPEARAFRLFGFSAESLLDSQRGKKAANSLRRTYLREYLGQSGSIPRELCFAKRGRFFRLTFIDSETEGFLYMVEELLKDSDPCQHRPAEFHPLAASQPFPLTSLGSGIAFGKSTLHQIRRRFGTPDIALRDRLIYVLRYDQGQKAKSCGEPAQSYFVGLEFRFEQNKLRAILLHDSIAGEC